MFLNRFLRMPAFTFTAALFFFACAATQAAYAETIDDAVAGETPFKGCDQDFPTVALLAADRLGILAGKQLHSAVCKVWPGDATRTLVALVREQDGATADYSTYDLDLVIVKTDGGEILNHIAKPGSITSDAMHFDAIVLDTANYTLAKGRRAFGLRTQHSHVGAVNVHDEMLSLYLPQGKSFKEVLELETDRSGNESSGGGDCNEAHSTTSTVAIGNPGKQGYADLVVTEQSVDQEVKTTSKGCAEVIHKSKGRYVVPFDGVRYVLPRLGSPGG